MKPRAAKAPVAKAATSKAPAAPPSKGVTLERAARLYRLVLFLGESARTRKAILQKLKIDIRTFYRDLELLRDCAIAVGLEKRKYVLETPAAVARLALPFPDPGLTLGEAHELAKGRGKVQKKLREQLKAIEA